MRNTLSLLTGAPNSIFTRRGINLNRYRAGGLLPGFVLDLVRGLYFTNSGLSTFADAITHTRASTATYVDSDGVLQTAAINEPRISHHVWNGSAWVNEGLLHESEARTNLVTNNQLGGAVVGVIGSGGALPTGWSSSNFDTVEVVSVDTWRGMPRIRVKGTRANATGVSVFPNLFFQTSLTLAATSGYTGSLWFGEGPDQTGSRASLILSDGPTLFVNQLISAPGTLAEPVFFNRTGTASGSPTAFGSMRLAATVEDGNTEVFDWVIVMPQMELGATPSSPIPTSGSTVTRAAETLTIPAANLPWPEPEVIGPELVTNGTFDTDTAWTKGTGWTISGGVASFSGGGLSGDDLILRQDNNVVNTGSVYQVTYTVSGRTAGVIGVFLRGSSPSVFHSTNDTFTRYIVAGSGGRDIEILANDTFDGSLDNISVREIKPLAVSIQMEGRVTFSDTDKFDEAVFYNWQIDGSNRVYSVLRTDSSVNNARVEFWQAAAGVNDASRGNFVYPPGVLVPFNVAARNGSNFVQGSVDGTAAAADTTPVALANLSASNLSLANKYNGTIRTFRMWANDIGDTGIEEASS